MRLLFVLLSTMFSTVSNSHGLYTDPFIEWNSFFPYEPMVSGTHESGSDVYENGEERVAKAVLVNLTDDNKYQISAGVYVVFRFNDPEQIRNCEKTPTFNKIRDQKSSLNKMQLVFSVWCLPTDFGYKIELIPRDHKEMAKLYAQFTASEYVTLNNYSFPAKGFKKALVEFKEYEGI